MHGANNMLHVLEYMFISLIKKFMETISLFGHFNMGNIIFLTIYYPELFNLMYCYHTET